MSSDFYMTATLEHEDLVDAVRESICSDKEINFAHITAGIDKDELIACLCEVFSFDEMFEFMKQLIFEYDEDDLEITSFREALLEHLREDL